MSVAVARLVELVTASWALKVLEGAMRLLVINHVAELGCLDHTVQALEHLVGAARQLVHHILLDEAQMLRVVAVSVTDALLDSLLQHGHRGCRSSLGRNLSGHACIALVRLCFHDGNRLLFHL